MKQTTNFYVYIDENNAVYCAKCRVTGKFIKSAVAQAEYSAEYVYKRSLWVLLTMFALFLIKGFSSRKMSLQCELDTIDKASRVACCNCDYVLFRQLDRQRCDSKLGLQGQ